APWGRFAPCASAKASSTSVPAQDGGAGGARQLPLGADLKALSLQLARFLMLFARALASSFVLQGAAAAERGEARTSVATTPIRNSSRELIGFTSGSRFESDIASLTPRRFGGQQKKTAP